MIAAFTTCTISHLNEKWCTALVGTTVQQFVREKLPVIFYLAAQKMITAADFRTSINPLLVILLTIPCPTFIQEALLFRRHFLQFCGCTLTGSKLSCLGEQSERRDNALVSDLQGKEGLQQSVINFSLYFAQMRGNTIGWKMTFWKSKLIDNRPSWPALNFRGKHRNTNFQDAHIAKTVMLAVRVSVSVGLQVKYCEPRISWTKFVVLVEGKSEPFISCICLCQVPCLVLLRFNLNVCDSHKFLKRNLNFNFYQKLKRELSYRSIHNKRAHTGMFKKF